MGLSSNQARFLSLTSRQIDMEQRIQQICQRRLRLSSELENVATSYNNSISNRKMFTQSTAQLQSLSIDTLKSLGYRVINSATKTLANAPIKAVNQLSESQITASYNEAHIIRSAADFQTKINADLGGSFVLSSDLDMSTLGTINQALVKNTFTGKLDGNGYVINNLNINSTANNSGLFAETNGATFKNIAIEDASVNAGSNILIGILFGRDHGSTIDNSYTTGTVNGNYYVGGLGGQSIGTTITNTYSTADVSGFNRVGGLLGENWLNSSISNSYATGSITGAEWTGGLVGNNTSNSTITNSYATGDILGGGGMGGFGGVVGHQDGSSSVTDSYATGNVSGSAYLGGVSGWNQSSSTDDSTNFYKNNLSSDAGTATANQSAATATWDTTNVWDMSTGVPTLKSTGQLSSAKLEEGLRNGKYSLAKEADEYTQDPLTINGDKYQEVDWRTTPEIYDELYQGDDAAAEDKYDRIIDEINSQDKKLQLEQTSIETEYKAVTSEKDAVKKILDTNAQSSFKYFS